MKHTLLSLCLWLISLTLYAQMPHVLTERDVAFTNGEISRYYGSHTVIIIPPFLDGQLVTSIGFRAFSNRNLTSVNISGSIKVIGDYAFESNSLTSVTLPESVTYIDSYAFAENNLTSIILPESVISIGNNAFANNNFSTFVLPVSTLSGNWSSDRAGESVSVYHAYYYQVENYSAKNVDFSFKDGMILDYYGPGGDIIIPDAINGEIVSSIGVDAFRSKNLVKVVLPESITSLGKAAFYYNSLMNITIPESVTSIGNYAFTDNNLTIVIIPSAVTWIGIQAFAGNGLTGVTIPQSVTSIGWQAFGYNNFSTFVLPNPTISGTWSSGIADGNVSVDGAYAYHATSFTASDANFIFKDGVILDYYGPGGEVIIPDMINGKLVTSIGKDAFAEKNLTNVIIPESVIRIGSYAFTGNSLLSVTIPESVTSIGSRAFKNNSLTTVTIPESVILIGYDAFNDNNFSTFILPSPTPAGSWNKESAGASVSVNSDYIYLISNYNALDTDFSFEDGVILDYYGPGGEVSIPEMINGQLVTSIGLEAFFGSSLTSVTIPESTTSIGSSAFEHNGLTSVTIPESVTYIGNSAFQHNALSQVTIPSSVTSLGYGAFYYNLLTNVTIPKSVLSIGGEAFARNSLTNVIIPESVTFIGRSAFAENNFTNFSLPSPSVSGFVFDGWQSSTGSLYDLGATTNDLSSEYSVLVSENNSLLISVLLEDFSGNISVSGDLSTSYEGISSMNLVVERGSDLTLATTVEKVISDYILSPSIWTIEDLQENISMIFTYGLMNYNLTYEADGGTHNNPSTYTIESGEIILEDAMKIGYTFDGWYREPAFANEVTRIASGSTADMTLYAKWLKVLSIDNVLTGVSIYPNPSLDGEFDILLGNTTASTTTVYTLTGELIAEEFNISRKVSLKIAQGPGVYILRITSAGKHYSQKLLVY